MRQRWVNAVMGLTAFLYKKKRSLLTSHALRSFFDILLIIFLEILLAVISLPLYAVASSIGEKKGKGGE